MCIRDFEVYGMLEHILYVSELANWVLNSTNPMFCEVLYIIDIILRRSNINQMVKWQVVP